MTIHGNKRMNEESKVIYHQIEHNENNNKQIRSQISQISHSNYNVFFSHLKRSIYLVELWGTNMSGIMYKINQSRRTLSDNLEKQDFNDVSFRLFIIM